jgi:hypothetical protein
MIQQNELNAREMKAFGSGLIAGFALTIFVLAGVFMAYNGGYEAGARAAEQRVEALKAKEE